MSEFTYACPVCGQHIKCDMSQSGSKMECPTCFQTIMAPDVSPMHDPKFIIQGTKVGERPVPGVAASGTALAHAPVKKSPAVALTVAVFVLAAGAAVFLFGGKLLKSTGVQTSQPAPAPAPGVAPVKSQPPAKSQIPPPPIVVAPPANDTNWMLDLSAATIPDSTVVGRIHGQNFSSDRATFQSGVLMFRVGTRGPVDWGITINFSGALPENLAGKTVNITTNATEAAKITLRWKDGDQAGKDNFNDSYAMRIEFGPLEGNRLSGKIYLCTPDDQKSYVTGAFDAEIRKPKPPKHQ